MASLSANPKTERKASRKIPQADPIKPSRPQVRRESQPRVRALHVLARMRRTGESLVSSSRLEGLDPRTVLKQIPREFHKSRGRWVPVTADRQPRPMRLLDDK